MKTIVCKTKRTGCCEREIHVRESDFGDSDGPHVHLDWTEDRKCQTLNMHDDQAERVAKAILRMVASHRTQTHREENRRIRTSNRKASIQHG